MKTTIFFFLMMTQALVAFDPLSCFDDRKELCSKLLICGRNIYAFDLKAEGLYLHRNRGGGHQAFTSEWADGQPILETSDLHMGWAPGYKLTGEIYIDNCDRIDVIYSKVGDFSDSKKVTSKNNQLWSVFSHFGTDPEGGFDDVDEAFSHQIKNKSYFNSLEVNWRKHCNFFQFGQTCCVNGSFLTGYRFIDFNEVFTHQTVSIERRGSMNYQTKVYNKLQGAQIGVDLWIPVCMGWDLVLDGKGIVFYTQARQRTTIEARHISTKHEKAHTSGYSTGAEFSAKISYQLCDCFYLRTGYEFFYLGNIALGPENFNDHSPFSRSRHKKISKEGHATFNGVSLGIDFYW